MEPLPPQALPTRGRSLAPPWENPCAAGSAPAGHAQRARIWGRTTFIALSLCVRQAKSPREQSSSCGWGWERQVRGNRADGASPPAHFAKASSGSGLGPG